MLISTGLQPRVHAFRHIPYQHVRHAYIMQARSGLRNDQPQCLTTPCHKPRERAGGPYLPSYEPWSRRSRISDQLLAVMALAFLAITLARALSDRLNRHVVGTEDAVASHHRQALHERLADQHPVKWIPVM